LELRRDHMKQQKTVEQRFWEKVGPHTDPNVCWLWLASTCAKGSYGQFRVGAKMLLVHRLSYEMHYHVTIPKGMTIDHVKARGCTSTLCVNPHHLEVVTQKVNVLRGDTIVAKNASKTYCPQGHPYNKENTYVYFGERQCRICVRIAKQKWKKAT